MKNSLLLLLFSFGLLHSLLAQKAPISNPNASLELRFKNSGGTNGSAVCYNSKNKLYYAVIAGNAAFPMETFDSKGNAIYQSEAYYDSRGMWYNANNNSLNYNGYGGGVYTISLDEKGFPDKSTGRRNGSIDQKNSQSVAGYDSKKNELVLLYGNILMCYNSDTYVLNREITLDLNREELESINYTTVIATGKTNYEYGVLDYEKRQVLFFNDSGKHTAVVNLPSNIATNEGFWFSYANGYVFTYSTKTRSWTGYRIFKK
ncbi:MAG: hypothetical protein EAZ55_11430 [Cytophagales bacterium]|nr:MAG: hypothetical protein EAZ55_11430 [Cytophagales bacterium]